MTTEELRGILSELRGNPWYMRLYFAQLAAWLIAVVVYQTAYVTEAPLLERIIDGGVTMSFLAYGSLVSSVIIVDGTEALYERAKELMGILIKPVRNKFEAAGEARGEKRGKAIGEARGEARGKAIGEAIGEARMAEMSAAWFAELRRALEEGREFDEPPPWEKHKRNHKENGD